MTRAPRIGVCAFVGVVASLLLPVYAHESTVRSTMMGGGGDRISYRWSMHTPAGLVDAWRYDKPGALELFLDGFAFAAVVLLVAFATARLVGRFWPTPAPR